MPEIQRVKYTHDAMIDLIIANPCLSQGQIAATFGYSQTWVSIIFNSDSFLERVEQRKEELVDPTIRATIEEKFKALADLSLQVVLDKLHATQDVGVALKGLDIARQALAYGARPGPQVQINNVQQVVVVPQKELTSEKWAAEYSPRELERPVQLIEHDAPSPDTSD